MKNPIPGTFRDLVNIKTGEVHRYFVSEPIPLSWRPGRPRKRWSTCTCKPSPPKPARATPAPLDAGRAPCFTTSAMKPTTLRSATELLAAIRAAGLTVTEYPDMPGLSTTSFSNPFTRACTVICVHFRHPPAGCPGRRSATVKTTVHSRYRPDYTHAGTWAAHYALRVHAEDAASWARATAPADSRDSAAL